MVPRDVEALVALHGEVLDMEFLTRYGPPFLRTYYRAWIDAPGGIALTAVDERDRVLGGLLGAVDPAQHVHAMLRVTVGHSACASSPGPRPIRSWRATFW